jgi:hypothetical protein
MSEVEIANELMKEFNYWKGRSLVVRIEIEARISAQLEANKRFLEFLKNLYNNTTIKESAWITMMVKPYIEDFQQAIKVLEGK